ncbi:MAG: hypothetical protein IIZ74_02940, partial [Erysipelotrichaceae bacterium]|nr:hypothetical protein [Erysipelotrichaceae bacterium]
TNKKDILPDVIKQIKYKSGQEEMEIMMGTTVKLVQSLKLIPLSIKRPVAKIVYGFLGDRVNTTFLSNLGVVKLPDDMGEHVEKFDFILGPSEICRANCSLITFKDKSVFSITKMTSDPAFEEKLLSMLEEDGLHVEVKGSAVYES